MKQQLKLASKLTLVFALVASLIMGAASIQPAYAETDESVLKVIESEDLGKFSVTSASEGRIQFYDENGYYGYMDYEGNVVIPAQYEYASPFSSGIAEVTTEKGQTYIDKEGNVVFYAEDILNQFDLESSYPDIYAFHDGMARVSTYDSVGYINTKGEFVIPMNIYYNGYDFSDGVVEVYDSNYVSSFIDTAGNVLFTPNPNYSYYGFSNGLAAVYDYDNGQYGYVDKTGELVIPTTLDEATSFVGDLAVYKELGKYGVINRDGKFLLHPVFKDLTITEDGYVIGYDGVFTVFLDSNLKPMKRVVGDELYGVYDNVFIKSNYDGYVFEDLSGVALGTFDDYYYLGDHIFELMDGRIAMTDDVKAAADEDSNMEITVDYDYMFLNNKGEVVIDLSEYDSVRPFSEGLAVVEKKGKFGYIDTEGNVVIPIKYIDADDFYGGTASVETVEDYLTIDKDGKVISSSYDYIEVDDDSEFYVISTGYYGNSGVASKKTSKIVLEPIYSSVTDAGGGLFEIMDENYNYGFYNANTGKVVEPLYDYITIYANENRVVVETDEYLYGMYDTDGNQILEPVYDYISMNDNGMYEVQKNYKNGIVNSEGEVIIKPEFDYIYTDQATENIVVFSTEKSNENYEYEQHILVYDTSKNKVLSDSLEGSAMGFGDTFLVIGNGSGKKTVSSYDGNVIFETEDYFIDSSGKYLHFEDNEGIDYLIDVEGKTYLEGNSFEDVYLPVEDERVIFYMNGGFGIVSLDGEIKTNKLYDNVYYITSGVMATYDEDMFGYVDLNGKDVVSEGYYDLLYGFTDGLGLVIKAND